MIDIGKKAVTLREACAAARIRLKPQRITLIREKKIPKGDIFTLAQCAGILAAKKVDELIPLCHPLALEHTDIRFTLEKEGVAILVRCRTRSKTGVEMEAMVACSLAALTIYDMCKSVDRGAVIEEIKLMEKKGGKSGHYKRR
ncbi:MAG: cyclic pyranopterin monophosphate synthase MoaC [Candidatus Omnitrophica bacterium]|nr:cyclic pyranopterin monophosphate synthase MoaC [Candidatus Omnitrophota bacterium]